MTRTIDDTIAATATSTGHGSIAIVRVSGPGAGEVARRFIKGASGAPLDLRPRTAAFCRVGVDGRGTLDEALAIWMPAPHSYTREDVLEIQTHGGRAASNAVLDEILKTGLARLADPGEFTLRAYLRGRIDLIQAEAVADVINSVSAESLKIHESLLEGSLSRTVDRWQRAMLDVSALIEASIDFPEDDLEPFDSQKALLPLRDVAGEMREKLDSYAWGRCAREGFMVTLAGAPNVGKSSLLNRFAEEERAIVSPHPGTTRDTIEAFVNLNGVPLKIVDTAGLRSAADEIEGEGIARAKRAASSSDLILFVLDATREPTAYEMEAIRERLTAGQRLFCVVNKTDLAGGPAYPQLPGELRVFRVSAATGEGMDELYGAVRNEAWSGAGHGEEWALTRKRHQAAVERAASSVAGAIVLLSGGGPLDLAASELSAAREALRGLLGWGAAEDVLEEIFSEFCIGK